MSKSAPKTVDEALEAGVIQQPGKTEPPAGEPTPGDPAPVAAQVKPKRRSPGSAEIEKLTAEVQRLAGEIDKRDNIIADMGRKEIETDPEIESLRASNRRLLSTISDLTLEVRMAEVHDEQRLDALREFFKAMPGKKLPLFMSGENGQFLLRMVDKARAETEKVREVLRAETGDIGREGRTFAELRYQVRQDRERFEESLDAQDRKLSLSMLKGVAKDAAAAEEEALDAHAKAMGLEGDDNELQIELPRSLHFQLHKMAEDEGVDMNTLVNSMLSVYLARLENGGQEEAGSSSGQ